MLEKINIQNKDGVMVVSSREVAVNFEKRHDKLMSEIERMYGNLIGMPKMVETPYFIENYYIHPQNNQRYKEYLMTRDGFSLLVMGFTGEKALNFKLKYIEAFNKMEQTLKRVLPTNYKEALKQLIASEEEKEKLQLTIKENEHKVLFADSVSASHTSILIGDLAKLIRQNGYDIGQNRLFEWLRNNGFLMKNGERKNMPTQFSMEKGLFEVKERTITDPNGVVRITRTTKVTGDGQVYFVNKFLNISKESDV